MKNKTAADSQATEPCQWQLPLSLRQWLAAVFMLAIAALAIGGAAAASGEASTPQPQQPREVESYVVGGYVEVRANLPQEPALATIHRWTGPTNYLKQASMPFWYCPSTPASSFVDIADFCDPEGTNDSSRCVNIFSADGVLTSISDGG